MYKESFPALRFIGKRYTDSDRGSDGGFSEKWDEWFEQGYFEPLEKLGSASAHGGAPIGCMRFLDEFEYWIGMFFPENTPVPDDYVSVDIPAGDFGMCWIYGRDDTGELYGPEAHQMCAARIEEAGWSIDHDGWFFERYDRLRFGKTDEQGNVVVDYGIYLKASPIKREVGNVFIPVTDIHRARAWYRDILDLPVGEVEVGHLCSIPMDNGTGMLLDQKLTPDNAGTAIQMGAYPLFMFSTDDIEASLAHLRGRGVEIVEYEGRAIQNGHWFNFRDCEGNLLMVCGPIL